LVPRRAAGVGSGGGGGRERGTPAEDARAAPVSVFKSVSAASASASAGFSSETEAFRDARRRFESRGSISLMSFFKTNVSRGADSDSASARGKCAAWLELAFRFGGVPRAEFHRHAPRFLVENPRDEV
jgi:hypothetical protein